MKRTTLAILTLTVIGLGAPTTADEEREWRIVITAMNSDAVQYEPAWIRWEEEYVGSPPVRQRVVGPYRACFRRPDDQEMRFGPAAYWFGRPEQSEATRPRPHEVRRGDYFVAVQERHHFLSTPGTYYIQLGCDESWQGDSVWKGEAPPTAPQSPVIRFTVSEPTGVNKRALEWAGGPGPLADLMGLGYLVDGGRKRWTKGQAPDPKRPLGRLLDAQAAFIVRFPDAVYTPYVLLHHTRLAMYGHSTREVQRDPEATHVEFLPDWSAVRESSDLFLSRYPDHPMADEAAFLGLRSAWELVDREDFDRRLVRFGDTYPDSYYVTPVERVLAGLLERRLEGAVPSWEYKSRWVTDQEGEPIIP